MTIFFSGFRKRLFWIILGVLIVAVSLTAQAPKSPPSSQSVSEVGRYVFWSVPTGKDEHKYGFLDTKRGRVWVRAFSSDDVVPDVSEWIYYDLNDEAEKYIRLDRHLYWIKALKFVGDTVGIWDKAEAKADLEIKQVREKEK